MIGSYLIFAVLGFILISTFTAHYNQNYLEQYYAAALRRESSQIADSFGNSYYRSELTLEEFQKQIAAVSSYLDADIYIVTTGRLKQNPSKILIFWISVAVIIPSELFMITMTMMY